MNKTEQQILKALHRNRREEEIALHGKPINIHHVAGSKKLYNRKLKHKKHWEE